jgi:hypothetical protein
LDRQKPSHSDLGLMLLYVDVDLCSLDILGNVHTVMST